MFSFSCRQDLIASPSDMASVQPKTNKKKILLFIHDKEKLFRHCIKWLCLGGGREERDGKQGRESQNRRTQ